MLMVEVNERAIGVPPDKGYIQLRRDEAPIVESIASISEVSPADWDQLAGENILVNYGLLRLIEETRTNPHASRYFLARDSEGIAGAVICHLEDKNNEDGAVLVGAHRLDRMLLGKFGDLARHLGVVTFPVLMCGNQIGPVDPVLVRRDASPTESRRIVEILVKAIERAARAEHWTICFRQVGGEDSPIRQILAERGYLRGSEVPTAYLELPPEWRSIEDYKGYIKKAHPNTARNVTKEMGKAKRMGLSIEVVEKPEEFRRELHELLEAHNLRLNKKPFPVRVDFFDRLKARMGDKAVITTARLNGALCGVQVRFQSGEDVVAWMIGIDESMGHGVAAYFNLNYNFTIETLIATGYRRINYGPLLWDVKERRGCRCLDTDFYLRGRNWLQTEILRPVVRMRMRRNDALSAGIREH
jgi:predicted N-acyltransferase